MKCAAQRENDFIVNMRRILWQLSGHRDPGAEEREETAPANERDKKNLV